MTHTSSCIEYTAILSTMTVAELRDHCFQQGVEAQEDDSAETLRSKLLEAFK